MPEAEKHSEWIVREGWPFAIAALLLTVLFCAVELWWVALSAGLLAVFVIFFFRNPSRSIPVDPRAIVSPADGHVVRIDEFGDGRTGISIFLSVFDVHVNRSPVGGVIASTEYHPGKFLAAFRQTASLENERKRWMIHDGDFSVEVVQIAGWIARRIVSWKEPLETTAIGERFGMIRFGSRVDLILPPGCKVVVKKGQLVRGGATLMALRPEPTTEADSHVDSKT